MLGGHGHRIQHMLNKKKKAQWRFIFSFQITVLLRPDATQIHFFFFFFTETEGKRTAVNNKPKPLCLSWIERTRDHKIIEFYFILFIFNNLCQIDPRSAHSSFLQIKRVYKWDTGNSGKFVKLIKQIIKCDKCVALQWAETSLCSGLWGTTGAGEEYRSILWLRFLKSTNNSNHLQTFYNLTGKLK